MSNIAISPVPQTRTTLSQLRMAFRILVSWILLAGAAAAQSGQEPTNTPIVLRAGTLLDGRGHALHNMQIVVENGKIVRVEKLQPAKGTIYDLGKMTVMPGWIDVHDHITWHFGPNGRVEDRTETEGQAALAAAANAYKTLMAGFTTVQSLGSPEDKALRASTAGGAPGPRILTALVPIADAKLSRPDSRGGAQAQSRWR
jgi:imidazolonepropionase-like amidohydrolase